MGLGWRQVELGRAALSGTGRGRVGLGEGCVGRSRVEWGDGLGMHWGAIKFFYYMPLILLDCQGG